MKPLGFYVSVPKGHEDCAIIKSLCEEHGEYFENVSKYDLWAMLVYCVQKPSPHFEINEPCYPLLSDLAPDTCFHLIPFLYQAIQQTRTGVSNEN